MNILAIDIGNSNITVGLFIDEQEKFIESFPGSDTGRLEDVLVGAWQQIPVAPASVEKKKDGIIVASSVKPAWTDSVCDICCEKLDEKVKIIGVDVPLPMEMGVDNSSEVGTDRIVAAAAAFAVVEDAVIVADFGTAVTIDLVDQQGVFMGGVICPGFDLAAGALKSGTAKLPLVKVHKPAGTYGANTIEAINNGIFYSAVGLLETMARLYAQETGSWPQIIVTGGSAELLKDYCEFIDSWVPNLVVRGIVLTYLKFIEEQSEPDSPGQ